MNIYSFQNIEAFAARFYQGRPLELTPYAYNLTFADLAASGAAGATATQNLLIQANADFLFTGMSHLANIDGTTGSVSITAKIAPYVRVLLTDSGSSQPMMNSAVPLENYSENGQFTRGLEYPRWIAGRSSLQVTLTNYSTSAYDIDLTFHGVNVRAL